MPTPNGSALQSSVGLWYLVITHSVVTLVLTKQPG